MWRFDRDDILVRIDLEALLDELAGPPNRHGRAARWHCIEPTHPDHRPSVTVTRDRNGIQRWRCWSGGHGGTAIDALVAAHGLTIKDAIEHLARRVGITPDQPPRSVRPRPPAPHPPPRPLAVEAVRYVEACRRILWTPAGTPVREWLVHERQIPEDVLRTNHVGADPGPRVLPRPRGLPYHGTGAVLPALAPDGTITYFQLRYLAPPPGRDRYDNPANRLGTNPRLGWIQPAHLRTPDVLVVCEGLIDAYTVAGAGTASVAILGAGYPDNRVAHQLAHNVRARHILIACDNDKAGRHAAARIRSMLATHAIPTTDICPPAATSDLNNWARHDPTWSDQLHNIPEIQRGPPASKAAPDADIEVPGVRDRPDKDSPSLHAGTSAPGIEL